MLYETVMGPQFQTFTLIHDAFSLGAGPQRVSNNFACNPKISTGFTWNKICFLIFLKAKTEEKLSQKWYTIF